jgi:hypothetical protein
VTAHLRRELCACVHCLREQKQRDRASVRAAIRIRQGVSLIAHGPPCGAFAREREKTRERGEREWKFSRARQEWGHAHVCYLEMYQSKSPNQNSPIPTRADSHPSVSQNSVELEQAFSIAHWSKWGIHRPGRSRMRVEPLKSCRCTSVRGGRARAVVCCMPPN